MANHSIYLEYAQIWNQVPLSARDPLRMFPELFKPKALGRSVATKDGVSTPEFQVTETRESFSLRASVPGMKLRQFDVRVTARLLSICARNEPRIADVGADPAAGWPRVQFTKTFVLPDSVEACRLNVDVTGELLTINLPKRVTSQAQQIAQRTR